MAKREKRLKLIDKHIERAKGRTDLSEQEIIQLLDDAIYLIDDFGKEWDKMFKDKNERS